MTVKIVSQGPVRTKKVVCSRCCYELEYTGVDVKSKTVSCLDDVETRYFINCPKCEHQVRVDCW